MKKRARLYDSLIADHLARHRQMIFLSGPRQVGKTTTGRAHAAAAANWDNLDDRRDFLAGPERLAERLGLDRLAPAPRVVLFDELHKYPRWRPLLKGFFDTYADQVRIIVTGSARMEILRRSGESLMGRYFLFRMHPFSVAELLARDLPDAKRIVRRPARIRDADFKALWRHGGYPEPFLTRSESFTRRWLAHRHDQLVRGDVRDLAGIQQIDQLELLAKILSDRSSCQLVLSNLATEVRASIETVKRWIGLLVNLHLGFLVRPWYRNVTRSLRKEPKWFLRDWSGIEDPGRRAETFVACHLLKAVDAWTDIGLGRFELAYLRDKEKREVDFVVIRDGKPWFLVEVKTREESLGKGLAYFQERIKAPFAFQAIIEADYVDADCFAAAGRAIKVPARTFLSQLV